VFAGGCCGSVGCAEVSDARLDRSRERGGANALDQNIDICIMCCPVGMCTRSVSSNRVGDLCIQVVYGRRVETRMITQYP
jgi:hypothetical protein